MEIYSTLATGFIRVHPVLFCTSIWQELLYFLDGTIATIRLFIHSSKVYRCYFERIWLRRDCCHNNLWTGHWIPSTNIWEWIFVHSIQGDSICETAVGYATVQGNNGPYPFNWLNWWRWFLKAPVPPDPWSDPPTRFFRGGSLAPQLLHKNGKVIGSEDCLHLCVYTRNLTPRVLAPVMVWIHGGAFAHGSITIDMYDPEYLLRDKIVLVAMNYRLGAFGESTSLHNYRSNHS